MIAVRAFSCAGSRFGAKKQAATGGSAGTGEQPSPVGSQHRRARRGGRRLRGSARPAEYLRPPRRSAGCDDGIHIVQFWTACPQRSSLRADAVNSAGAPGWPRSASGRLNSTQVRRCGQRFSIVKPMIRGSLPGANHSDTPATPGEAQEVIHLGAWFGWGERCKSPGWAPSRGWPTESTCPPRQPQV